MEKVGIGRRGFFRVATEAVKTGAVTYACAYGGEMAFRGVSTVLSRSGAIGLYKSLAALEPVSVGPHEVGGFGVAHTVENFLAHQDQIRAQIKGSSAVVLEYFGTGWRNLSKPSVTDAELRGVVSEPNGDVFGFFSGVGKLCAQEGIDIFTVNPQSRANFLIDMYFLGGTLIQQTLADQPLTKPIFDTFLTRHPIARRVLLGLNIAALASWLPTRGIRELIEKTPLGSDTPPKNRANLLGWNLTDYRDIKSAIGVKRVLGMLEAEGSSSAKIQLIQGELHNGVMEYLQRDLDWKGLLYPHYDLVADKMIRRYRFNPTDDSWSRISEVAY